MTQNANMQGLGIEVRGLAKSYGKGAEHPALHTLDVLVPQGEIFVLLGPSGCGKSTTLRCIAGLERADAGRITLQDQVVFDQTGRIDIPTEKRGLGMVFQNYGLWPHMTVRQNIEFPLRMRGYRQEIIDIDVKRFAELVECGSLLHRYPWQLSGGQQQRVSLARALVGKPKVLLMDEPLSNLDARLRRDLRIEIARLHHELRFTAVYVTHDQVEALALGNQMAVMRQGTVMALGQPSQLYGSPPDEWTADFLGATNRLAQSGDVVRFRPEVTEVLPRSAPPRDGLGIDGHLITMTHAGDKFECLVDVGGATVLARVPGTEHGGLPFEHGAEVRVCVSPQNAFRFGAASAAA